MLIFSYSGWWPCPRGSARTVRGLLTPRAVRRAVTDAGEGPRCPQCDAELFERHCKYVCPHHGVIMDCGDTFYFS